MRATEITCIYYRKGRVHEPTHTLTFRQFSFSEADVEFFVENKMFVMDNNGDGLSFIGNTVSSIRIEP